MQYNDIYEKSSIADEEEWIKFEGKIFSDTVGQSQ